MFERKSSQPVLFSMSPTSYLSCFSFLVYLVDFIYCARLFAMYRYPHQLDCWRGRFGRVQSKSIAKKNYTHTDINQQQQTNNIVHQQFPFFLLVVLYFRSFSLEEGGGEGCSSK